MILVLVLAVSAARGQDAPAVTVSTGDVVAQGDATLVVVECACEATAVTVESELQDAPLPLVAASDGSWHGLIGVDVFTVPGVHPLALMIERAEGAPLTRTHDLEVVSKAFPTRQLTDRKSVV